MSHRRPRSWFHRPVVDDYHQLVVDNDGAVDNDDMFVDHNHPADNNDNSTARNHVDDRDHSTPHRTTPFARARSAALHRLRRPEQRPSSAGSWGEYLDDEWYYQSPAVPPRPEPWRDHPLSSQAVLVPRHIVEMLAQPARVGQISRDTERLDSIRASLLSDGLKEPLEIVVDGRIVLRNGHHRLTCTTELPGFEMWPVVFAPSDGIRCRAIPIANVMALLLTEAETPQHGDKTAGTRGDHH